jgi:cobalt-zinc-cadmium resistance protein CzcA
VQGLVLGLRGANAQQVVEGVRAKLAELAPTLPAGVTIAVFYDRGELVERAVGTVVAGAARSHRAGGGAAAAVPRQPARRAGGGADLPLAALVTFMLMRVIGMSANLMSLGGLAIAIGMLVDAAVVVVENMSSTHSWPMPRPRPTAPAARRSTAPCAK